MSLLTLQQFLKYGVVGVGSLCVDVGVFTLARLFGLDLILANVLARLAGAVAAYLGNFLWTFGQTPSQSQWLRSSWRYAVLWVGATVLSTLLLDTLIRSGINETVSKVAVEAVTPFINFFIARVWVFSTAVKYR